MATAADRLLAEAVAQAVQHRFKLLPKTGKNQPHEHTVLAGIVAYHVPDQPHDYDANAAQQDEMCTTGNEQTHAMLTGASSSQSPTSADSCSATPQIHVIALGTGTKCLGASKRSPTCDVINDSHAEVVARRAFVAWVYQQLLLAADRTKQQQQQQHNQEEQQHPQHKQDDQQQQQLASAHQQHGSNSSHLCGSAFYWCPESCRFKLHRNIKFALFVSQPPCGDASIYGSLEQEQQQQLASVSAAGKDVGGEGSCYACCSTASEDKHAAAVLQNAFPLGNGHEPGQQQQQQQVHIPAGRTGAKLIRLAGATDVGQAAAALHGRASAGAGADADAAPAASESCRLHPHEAPEQQEARATPQQAVDPQQQQQQHMVPAVPCACDVESGPQQLGVLRRKPGKGDPTLSLSCSDKIARWACLGMQGSLLSSCLAEPLYLSLLVVAVPPSAMGRAAAAAEAAAAEAAAAAATTAVADLPRAGLLVSCELLAAAEGAGRRAFAGRLAACAPLLQQPFAVRPPVVVAVQPAASELGLYPDDARKSPSGVSINWTCQLPLLTVLAHSKAKGNTAAAAGMHEVTLAAHGRKAGAGRKAPNWSNAKTQSRLCSAAIYQQWQALLAAVPELQQQQQQQRAFLSASKCRASANGTLWQKEQDGDRFGDSKLDITSYRGVKTAVGRGYQQAWNTLRQTPGTFAEWLVKP